MDHLLSSLPVIGYLLDRWQNLIQLGVEVTRGLFERWGYLVVLFGTLLENTLFLGVIIPGAFILLLAGFSAEDGIIDLRLALVLGIVGTSLGDTLSYLAGRFGWRRALAHAEELPFMGTVRATLLRRTGVFVLCYHFLGYTRLLGPVTAGALRLPFRRWWLLDLLGAAVWVTAYMVGGYVVGSVLGISLDTADENVRKLDKVLLVFGGLAVLTIIGLRTRSIMSRDTRPEPDKERGPEPADEQEPSTPRA